MKKSELLEEIDSLHETGNCHLIKTENDQTYRDGEEKDLQKLIDKLKTFLRKGKK